jgi:hypothetical protein
MNRLKRRSKKAWKCGHSQCIADRQEIARLTAENIRMAREIASLVEDRELLQAKLDNRCEMVAMLELEEQINEAKTKAAAKKILEAAHSLL